MAFVPFATFCMSASLCLFILFSVSMFLFPLVTFLVIQMNCLNIWILCFLYFFNFLLSFFLSSLCLLVPFAFLAFYLFPFYIPPPLFNWQIWDYHYLIDDLKDKSIYRVAPGLSGSANNSQFGLPWLETHLNSFKN